MSPLAGIKMDSLSYFSLVAGIIFGAVLFTLATKPRPRGRLPPGPRRLPIIGNVHQIPKDEPWVTFGSWSKLYGDIIYLDFMGQPAVVINKQQIALDLLSKRSAIYSNRPVMEMVSLCGYNNLMVLQHYGEGWKRQRRIAYHDYTPANVQKHFPLQEQVMKEFVRSIVEDPSAIRADMSYRMGIVIFRMTYGYVPRGRDDPFVQHAIKAVANFKFISNPGQWLVDVLPAMKYLPRWMPGTSFLRTAEVYRHDLISACFEPFKWAKANLATGQSLMPNLVGNLLENSNGEKMSTADQEALPWAALSMLGGALDTNISTVLCFLMFMILHPDVQSKAQAEIERVIGKSRLPSITDRPQLPYIRSIITETLRRGCPPPLSAPHALSQDDEYNGFFLPKGTWVMPNVWQMCHDPEVYPDPEVFRPERYNNDDKEMEKLKSVMFGFGRRVCLGRDFGEAGIFVIVATIFATCDILPGLDEKGNALVPKVEFTNGSIREPKPFAVRLKPKSPEAATLLAEIPTTTHE